MVAHPDEDASLLAGKDQMGRRRRRWREPAFAWWIAFGCAGAVALLLNSWRLAVLLLLFWCLYEFCFVPTVCRIITRQGHSCVEPVRGRLFACTVEHQSVKADALWRTVGFRNPRRRPVEPDPNRTTGVVVVSPAVRGRLSEIDRVVLILAATVTLTAVAGTVLGYLRYL
jgi:hypothetical protein